VIRVLLFPLLAAALALYTFWIYLRAELPVRSGRRLAALRSSTLLLVLALLLDLHLPWGGSVGPRPRWALLDASLSMGAGAAPPWRAAAERARRLEAQGWTVVRFGGRVAVGDGVPGAPDELRTALAPAVARAAEAGAAEVRVLSDLRFDDPVEVASALALARLRTEFEAFGGDVPNAGVAAFTVSDQLERGEAVGAALEVFAERAGDSLVIEVREEDRLVLSRTVAAPEPGTRARLRLDLPAPRGEGRLRYAATLRVPDDAFPSDDVGVAYMSAGHESGGLVVVSLRPDWEPRALLEVLADATGLRATGYLRVGPDRFAPMGRAYQRGLPVDSIRVAAAARDAALLVVHGLDRGTDGWGRRLARRSGRTVLWPLDAQGAGAVDVRTGAPTPGEWYPVPETSASPLASELAGARWQDLPPLGPVLPLVDRRPTEPPLLLRFRGTGPGQPALLLDRTGTSRRAVVLASGFWRWTARSGEGRDAYRRLWSGVAGWLLAQDPATVAGDVRPESWVVARGDAVRWWVPGAEGDSVRLEVRDSARVVVDTLLAAGSGRSVGPLPPATYRFSASTPDGTVAEGRFDVEARTTEMLPRPTTPEAASPARSASMVGSTGRPLRTSPWPYLLILALLSVEWVARRRAGLR
jgi:hypothetical protein